MISKVLVKYKGKEASYTVPILAMVNLLLAAVAMIKDMVLASFMGTTDLADAFTLAFYIPDIIGNTLVAASVGIACIPVFTAAVMTEENEEPLASSLWSFRKTTAILCHNVIWGSLTLAFLLFLFRGSIVQLMGKGSDIYVKSLTERLLTVMLPVVALAPLVTLGSGVCHVKKRFIVPGIAPVIFNLTYLLGILCSRRFSEGIKALTCIACFVSAGTFFMTVAVWGEVILNKLLKSKKVRNGINNPIKHFLSVLLPYILILLIYQSVGYVERSIASTMGTGNIAGLNYAYRISQLPVWVFAAAIGTVSFPAATRLAEESPLEFRTNVIGTIRSVFLIVLPASVIIHILREPIVNILFNRGNFDGSSTAITSKILAGYSLAILGQSLFLIGVRFFIAVKSVKIPSFIALVSSVVNIGTDYLLKDVFGVASLGYGAAMGGVCYALLVLKFLDQKIGLNLSKEFKIFVKVTIACLSTGVTAFLLRFLWSGSDSKGFLMNMVYSGLVVTACVTVYVVSLRLLGVNPLCSVQDRALKSERV